MKKTSIRYSALVAFLLFSIGVAQAQTDPEPFYESRFVDLEDLRMHYLDFGGKGFPLIFIHGAARGAITWKDFAPKFTDQNRVLAITARGVGESVGELPANSPSNPKLLKTDVETRASDILDFMETLEIEKAVFIGNSSPAQDMTFLAEHYPERAAGLVYLANAPPIDGFFDQVDTTGVLEMAARATDNVDPFSYTPEYLKENKSINVPALTFVSSSTGTRGMENMNMPLIIASHVSKEGADWIEDEEARKFFIKLIEDEDYEEQLRKSWSNLVVPWVRQKEEAFQQAFGDHLKKIPLDLPFITGYEYMNAPDLIYPHIRSFLKDIDLRKPKN